MNRACDRPLPQPRNLKEARAVVDEKIRRRARDIELNHAAQSAFARQHFSGARVLGCDSRGCNTTAGRLEGGRGLMFCPGGVACSASAGGIVSCR